MIDSLRFSPDDDRLGFTLSPATSSSDIYSIELAAATITRWAESEIGFQKKNRRDYCNASTMQFWQQHLPGDNAKRSKAGRRLAWLLKSLSAALWPIRKTAKCRSVLSLT
ncbi:hypothetical protein [Tahibacter aquaticus]|uniref:hypothetical protein n=1 Tax=Tahibacter aquaticus TaxID=520092 RepID=UPI00105F20CF|nr:hypothetical protein [Tahibacter aquaticus]